VQANAPVIEAAIDELGKVAAWSNANRDGGRSCCPGYWCSAAREQPLSPLRVNIGPFGETIANSKPW
jgi:hypothetical protein